MICPKCGSRNAYIIGGSGDTSGRITNDWFCPECNHYWDITNYPNKTTQTPKVAELPYEIEINGIKYRRVEE